jgi:predicted MFS family arabinose efflux permease
MAATADDDEDLPSRASALRRPHLNAREWLLLLVLAAVQFNHIVDFMIIMPLGPTYMREMGLSPRQFGGVVAAYTISAAVANLLAVFFIDRFDRKRALLTAFAGFTAGTLLCAVAPDYVLLLAARIVAGAFGGVASGLVMAIIGDAFHDSRRGFATGIVMSAFSVASCIGLPLGLYFADTFGWHAPFAILAGISAGVLLVAALVLPPLRGHLAPEADGELSIARSPRLLDFVDLLADTNHVRAFALMMAMMVSGFLIGPYIPTFLTANVGMAQADLKFIYLAGGIATILTMAPIGWIADRLGKLATFRVMAVLTMIPLLWIIFLPHGTALALVLTITTLQMVTMSGRMVPAMAMITASAAPGQRGAFMSLNTAVQHLSAGVATALGGAILSQLDAEGPLMGAEIVGLLCCIATVLSLYLAGRLRRAPDGDAAPDSLSESSVEPVAEGVPAFEE